MLYSGLDVSEHIEELRPYIGYVAEENACIQQLTVQQWLRCAGRLRVPDISSQVIDQRIDQVLQDLLLADKKKALLASLSLGQRKRILLATELVADTPVLFVDEVTSNVDVGSEESILGVLRRKVSRGHLVIMITHHDINLEDFDTVLFMCRGRLVYAGDPTALLKFFDAVDFRDLNKAVKSDAPVAEQDRMAAVLELGFLSNTKVSGPIAALKQSPVVTSNGKVPGPGVTSFGRQLRAMFVRNAQAFLKDRGALFFALAFGPLVALFLGLTIDTRFGVDTLEAAAKLKIAPGELATLDPQVLMQKMGAQLKSDEFWEERQAVITTVFFRKAFQAVLIIVVVISGLLIASMQIVKEQHLYIHERTVGVRRDAFLAAKMGWLTVVGAVMALGIAYTATFISDSGGPPGSVALLLFATALASLALGLAVSAWAKSPEVALFAALGLVVLQIVFSGVIPALGGAAKVGGYLSPAFFGARGMLSTLDFVTMSVLAEIDTETSPLSLPVTVLLDMALVGLFLGLAWWGLAKRDQRGIQRE